MSYGERVSISTDSKYLGADFSTYTGLLWRIGGFTLEGVRAAIDAHDAGSFAQSSVLALVASRWAPIARALRLRESPMLGVEREVTGGDRGAGRRAKEGFAEIMYEQGEPMFGDLSEAHATLGFQWFHATWLPTPDGAEVRPLLKPWPAAATWIDLSTGRFRAWTQGHGMVDMIDGDGKWFLVGDGSAPWLRGAVRSFGTQWAGGIQVERNELALTDYLGRKVPIAIMPDKVAVKDPVGVEICDATRDIGKARSGAGFPHGTEVTTLDNIDAGTATLLQGVLDRRGRYVVGVLLGTDGGEGSKVYLSPQYAGITAATVRRDLTAAARAFSRLGDAYGALNFGLSAKESPGYRWLLPDPSEAERVDAKGKAYLQAAAVLKADKDNGITLTKDRVAQVYGDLGVPPPPFETASPAGA